MNVDVLDTDITRLEVDAIANAANTDLKHGGAVAGAISRAGMPSIGARSLALLPFGTDLRGSPMDEAARIEIDEVFRHRDAGGSAIERVVFAVHGDAARAAFEAALSG